jgi:hypothetical protein
MSADVSSDGPPTVSGSGDSGEACRKFWKDHTANSATAITAIIMIKEGMIFFIGNSGRLSDRPAARHLQVKLTVLFKVKYPLIFSCNPFT